MRGWLKMNPKPSTLIGKILAVNPPNQVLIFMPAKTIQISQPQAFNALIYRKSVPTLLLILLLLSSCMNMRVVAEYDSNNPVPEKVTKVAWVWGLVQPKDIKTDSNCESICMVTTQNNLGYILISAVTLGIIVPLSIEYHCCAFDPGEGDI